MSRIEVASTPFPAKSRNGYASIRAFVLEPSRTSGGLSGAGPDDGVQRDIVRLAGPQKRQALDDEDLRRYGQLRRPLPPEMRCNLGPGRAGPRGDEDQALALALVRRGDDGHALVRPEVRQH